MNDNKTCDVFHANLWGLREKKRDFLLENDIKTTEWQKLSPKSEFYLFIPRDERLLDIFHNYLKISNIFLIFSLSIQTHRDNFVIDFEKKQIINKINMLKNKRIPDADLIDSFKLKNTKSWNIRDSREKIISDNSCENKILKILYRTFDFRWIFYHEAFVDRTRKDIMKNMFCENLGLLVSKQQAIIGFHHVFVTDIISESCVVSNKTKEGNYHFPLYIFPDINKNDLFTNTDPQEKQPNINPVIFRFLTDFYNKKPTPEDIFYYIYAVLYSNIYREKYAEFLKIDFPRVPSTKDYGIFKVMGAMGERLAGLHLLKSSELDRPIVKFPVEGSNKIENAKIKCRGLIHQTQSRVYINKIQYFEGVPPDVWEYQIGGYQVCRKWLKDRKGRKLSNEDIKHYCRIVMAIKKTIELQNKIDEFYPDVEKNLIEFNDT